MKAMILAAGLGTRLRPLTSGRPKALVPVGNWPVIDRVIHYLKGQGVTEIMVNAHHYHRQILSHLDEGRPFGIPIRVSVEPHILGTGGGIKKTEAFWGPEPFVVINSDILTDVDLDPPYEAHLRSGALATMILHDCEPFNQVLVDQHQEIVHIANEPTASALAFTGIHIVDPELLEHIPPSLHSDIIDCYRKLIEAGSPPRGYRVEGFYWRDMGTIESYMAANREAMGKHTLLRGPGCRMAGSVRVMDWAVIGENSVVEEEALIQRSVLWEGVQIRRGVTVGDSIITSSKVVETDLHGEIV